MSSCRCNVLVLPWEAGECNRDTEADGGNVPSIATGCHLERPLNEEGNRDVEANGKHRSSTTIGWHLEHHLTWEMQALEYYMKASLVNLYNTDPGTFWSLTDLLGCSFKISIH